MPVATGNDYAPTPAGAAIILRTDLVLRLATAQPFAGAAQTNFATAIRSLLAPYSFMSVAVTAFAVCPSPLQGSLLTFWAGCRPAKAVWAAGAACARPARAVGWKSGGRCCAHPGRSPCRPAAATWT